ncbi:hypothetical protein AMECASPLE_014779 [Ameca splendens]|uniref:Uncharacterized protein n=1 Tax=Ameca splendens TaxID=208324 RepID=A0ABV0ZZU0_9TELE
MKTSVAKLKNFKAPFAQHKFLPWNVVVREEPESGNQLQDKNSGRSAASVLPVLRQQETLQCNEDDTAKEETQTSIHPFPSGLQSSASSSLEAHQQIYLRFPSEESHRSSDCSSLDLLLGPHHTDCITLLPVHVSQLHHRLHLSSGTTRQTPLANNIPQSANLSLLVWCSPACCYPSFTTKRRWSWASESLTALLRLSVLPTAAFQATLLAGDLSRTPLKQNLDSGSLSDLAAALATPPSLFERNLFTLLRTHLDHRNAPAEPTRPLCSRLAPLPPADQSPPELLTTGTFPLPAFLSERSK